MILSPYRNPAYKPLTPHSPPSGPSPKRKRTDSIAQTNEALHVQTHIQGDHDDLISGCDSPRSKVAAVLGDLQIDTVKFEHAGAVNIGSPGKKRLKRNAKIRPPLPSAEPIIPETPLRDQTSVVDLFASGRLAEIEETPPESLREQISSPSDAGGPDLLWSPAATVQEYPTRSPSKHRISPRRSTSPRVVISPPLPLHQSGAIPDRTLSPLRLDEDLSLDQVALTWQHSEITGHEIDYSRGDDGLGVNGIGFRPTAAMAYARSQKRKQQVNDWKAREAREARQRRMDRRRRASSAEADLQRRTRMVRFDEAG